MDHETEKRREFISRLHQVVPQNSSYVSRLLFSILLGEARS